jgi:tetratricopeptide (TPR) repeat protein
MFAAMLAAVAVSLAEPPVAQPSQKPTRSEMMAAYKEGQTLQRVGYPAEAAEQYEKALAICEQIQGTDHIEGAALRSNLAPIYQKLKKNVEAEAHLNKALAICDAKVAKDSPQTVAVLRLTGDFYRQTGQPAKATPVLARLLAVQRAKYPAEDPRVTLAVNDLGVAYDEAGVYGPSEALLRENLAVREKSLGKDHPHALLSLQNLAHVYMNMERCEEALPLYGDWLERNARGYGEKHPAMEIILICLATCHRKLGHDAEAEKVYVRCLARHEQIAGKDDAQTAQLLRELAGVRMNSGPSGLAKARQCAERAVRISRTVSGADDAETGRAASRLGEVCHKEGKLTEAESSLRQGITILQAKLGKDHTETVWTTLVLTNVYLAMNRLAEAEATWQGALEVLEKQPGPPQTRLFEHLFVIASDLYNRLGNPDKGRARLERAVAGLESRLGKDHLDMAAMLIAAGASHRNLGQLASAKECFKRAVEIRRAKLGKDHPTVTEPLQAMATICVRMASYSEAEPLYLESVKICREKLGEEHPRVASCLCDLGFLYQRMGRTAAAEAIYRRGLAIAEKNRQQDVMEVILSYCGRLYSEVGRHDLAEPMLKKAVAMGEEFRGKNDPEFAWSLIYLSEEYGRADRYPEAEPVCRRALEIFETAKGKNHPDVMIALQHLGRIHVGLGRDDDADQVLRRSLAILQSGRTLNDRDLACTLADLSAVCIRRGRWEEAITHTMEERKVAHRQMLRVLPGLSPVEQLLFLARNERESFFSALSIGLAHPNSRQAVDASAEWLLNGKALAAEGMADAARLARQSRDPAVAAAVKELAFVRGELAKSILTPVVEGAGIGVAAREQDLKLKEQELVKQLGRMAGTFGRADSWVTLDQVRKALPPKTVLVEVAAFPIRQFDAKSGNDVFGTPCYAAWVIPPAGQGEVRLIKLGDLRAIDLAVAESRSAMEAFPQQIQALGERVAADKAAAACGKLSLMVWVPIQSAVGDATSVIISPDGGLGLFPWEALLTEYDKFLIEQKQISYVVTGRNLVAPTGQTAGKGAVVFAEPDLEVSLPDAAPAEPDSAWSAWAKTLFQSANAADRPAGAKPSEPREVVGKTKALVAALARYQGVAPTVYAGPQARESAVKSLRSPKVLVFTTHGFFAPDQAFDNLPLTDADRAFWARLNDYLRSGAERNLFNPVADPLLRCGLALAGAAHRSEAKGANDGILTGLEILGLDLAGTELVVVIACQGGVGAVRLGEGTAGLRQAFHLAGARTVVAALWSVPIIESDQLAEAYLANLAKKEGKAAALRHAQLALMATLRKRSGAAHPALWAGFTLTGDWR